LSNLITDLESAVEELRVARKRMFSDAENHIREFEVWRGNQQELLREAGESAWYKLTPLATTNREYYYLRWSYAERPVMMDVASKQRKTFPVHLTKAKRDCFFNQTKLSNKSQEWERNEIWELELKLGALREPLIIMLKAIRDLEKTIALLEDPPQPKTRKGE